MKFNDNESQLAGLKFLKIRNYLNLLKQLSNWLVEAVIHW